MKSRALWYAFSALLWATVPLAASAAGLVPCGLNGDAAATCNICTFGQLLQNIINFAIGLSIPLSAVLFSYAGWLYFSNRENTSQIEKAHRIFTTVFIGFCIAIGGWLIVQTVLKTLAPGYQSWTTFTCNNADRAGSGAPGSKNPNLTDLFQQSGLPGLTSVAPPPMGGSLSGTVCPGGSSPSVTENGNVCVGSNGAITPAQYANAGAANNAIAAGAAAYYGTDTSSGPGGGNVACAWAVNNILQKEGIPSIDGNLVADMQTQLQNGRGTPVDLANAQAGDIVIWKTDTVSHVGICYNANCSQVVSNSSNSASFTNISGTTFQGVPGNIYRVNK